MPATFESLGLQFLYPDNWTLAKRSPEDGIEGVTFDLPNGGFFSIERLDRLGPQRLTGNEEVGADDDLLDDYLLGDELLGGSIHDVLDEGLVSPTDPHQQQEALIEAIENLIAQEYGEVERDQWPSDRLASADRIVEFSFYYLDLLIISRLIFIRVGDGNFAIQIQSESRSFEENELVFAAIMQQLQSPSES
jgi:hypothetical protein